MDFDYVIIGGGSAGATLAGRLSEDPKTRVCLVEAGREDSPFLRTPFVTALMVPGKLRNWAFNTVPQAALNNRIGYQPRGKILGGSSGINAMIYIRGHATDYDDWAAMGAKGWSYADVLPYFVRAENNESLRDTLHGQGGPLNVADLASPNPLNDVFLSACDQMQLPRNADFNGTSQDGMGLYQVTQKNGERLSTARAYLTEANRRRPNLQVLTDAMALRILFEGKRASGALVKRGDKQETITARRAVLLAAGAFQSPQMLMLSGIGPGAELKRQGIEVRQELPGVGRNLQDHPDFTLMYKAASPHLFGFTPRALMRLPGEIRRYRREGKGLMTTNFAESGGFLRTEAGLPRPDVQYHFVMGLVDDHARKRHFGTGYSLHTCVLRPKSRGSVGLNDADAMSPPRIDPQFLADPADMETMLKGVKIGRRILDSEPFRAIPRQELYTDGIYDDEALRAEIRKRCDTIYHPVGTCRMGAADDPAAVVDPGLKVRGVDGLHVIDASVMPTLIGGNTNAPTIMIAEKAADLLRAH